MNESRIDVKRLVRVLLVLAAIPVWVSTALFIAPSYDDLAVLVDSSYNARWTSTFALLVTASLLPVLAPGNACRWVAMGVGGLLLLVALRFLFYEPRLFMVSSWSFLLIARNGLAATAAMGDELLAERKGIRALMVLLGFGSLAGLGFVRSVIDPETVVVDVLLAVIVVVALMLVWGHRGSGLSEKIATFGLILVLDGLVYWWSDALFVVPGFLLLLGSGAVPRRLRRHGDDVGAERFDGSDAVGSVEG